MGQRQVVLFWLGFCKGANMCPQRISCLDDSVLWEPALKAREPRTNSVNALGEETVGDSRKAVLFLDERWNAFANCLIEKRTTCKTTDAHHNLRFVCSKQFPCFYQAAQEFERKGQVAGAGQRSVDSADPQAVDVVTCGGNLVHFHSPQRPNKPDVGLWISTPDFIGNGQGRVNVATGASSRNEHVLYHPSQVKVFADLALPMPALDCCTTRVTASIIPKERQVNRSDVPP